jgi:hypothetical protein
MDASVNLLGHGQGELVDVDVARPEPRCQLWSLREDVVSHPLAAPQQRIGVPQQVPLGVRAIPGDDEDGCAVLRQPQAP